MGEPKLEVACYNCRYYPFCRMQTAIQELNSHYAFLRINASEKIAEMCKEFVRS